MAEVHIEGWAEKETKQKFTTAIKVGYSDFLNSEWIWLVLE